MVIANRLKLAKENAEAKEERGGVVEKYKETWEAQNESPVEEKSRGWRTKIIVHEDQRKNKSVIIVTPMTPC